VTKVLSSYFYNKKIERNFKIAGKREREREREREDTNCIKQRETKSNRLLHTILYFL
jgi:hypothetical protein